mgnify:CR=1 FL=1
MRNSRFSTNVNPDPKKSSTKTKKLVINGEEKVIHNGEVELF